MGATVVQTTAERLPFEDDSFEAAMAILTLHHWSDVEAGLAEMVRVARPRVVIVGFDPACWDEQGVVRDYMPEISERALEQLRRDLESGAWDERYGNLRGTPEWDVGLRLIQAELGASRAATSEGQSL